MKGATKSSVGTSTHVAVSIHAPMKGATLPPLLSPKYIGVSIHAPMKGATVLFIGVFALAKFQSTHP